MGRTFTWGAASQTVDLFIQDSSSTTGLGLGGLAFGSSGLKAYYRRGPLGTAIAITLVTQTVTGNYTTGGFVEIDGTNMKGAYRLDLPDAVLSSTGSPPWFDVFMYGATNMAPVVKECEFVAYNPFDSIRLGLAAMPNTAAESPGGLFTRGSGAGQINQQANGQIDVNAARILNVAVNTAVAQIGANVVTYATGMVPLQPTVAGNTLDVSAAGNAGIDWNNIAAPTTVVDLSGTTISTAQAVIAVVGSVGSVTGNVGGNVAGSVGSVVGAVGSVTGNVGGNILGSVATALSFGSVATAQIRAQVVAGLSTDTYGEVTGAPTATATLATKIGFNYEALRNGLTVSSTAKVFLNDAGAAQWSKVLSDDGTTYTEAEGS